MEILENACTVAEYAILVLDHRRNYTILGNETEPEHGFRGRRVRLLWSRAPKDCADDQFRAFLQDEARDHQRDRIPQIHRPRREQNSVHFLYR